MDNGTFDRFTRLVGSSGTRRGTLGALAILALFGAAATIEAKKPRRHRHGRKPRGASGDRVSAQAAPDCANPGPSQNLKDCNFQGDDLAGVDLSSSNLRGANFRNADLRCADLSSSNLRQADFRNADLSKADLHSSACNGTLFNAGTLFCQTIMCDGSVNDSDCAVVGEPCCGCGEGQCCADGTCQTGAQWDRCGSDGATCQVCAEGDVCAGGEGCVSCASQSGSTLCDRLTDPRSVQCSDQFCNCAEKADGSGSVCYFNPACQASPLPPICATDEDCVFPTEDAVCILAGSCEFECNTTACALPCGLADPAERRGASAQAQRPRVEVIR